MRKNLFAVLSAAVFLAAIFLWMTVSPLGAAQKAAGQSPAVSGKLSEILKNQNEIMRRLTEIKAELGTIKIRVTSR